MHGFHGFHTFYNGFHNGFHTVFTVFTIYLWKMINCQSHAYCSWMHALAVWAESRVCPIIHVVTYVHCFQASANHPPEEGLQSSSLSPHPESPGLAIACHPLAQVSYSTTVRPKVSKHNVQGRNGTRTLNITNTIYRGTVQGRNVATKTIHQTQRRYIEN